MTKNRARKRAVRDRAAATGERYIVARQRVAVPTPAPTGVLDALTHRVPGVPAHVAGGLQARRSRTRARRTGRGHQGRPNPAHGEPRLLIAWQNRVARLFVAK